MDALRRLHPVPVPISPDKEVAARLDRAQAYITDRTRVTPGAFTGQHGVEIPYLLCHEKAADPDAPALVHAPTVVVTGYGEAIAKYAEVAYDLVLHGFPVYLVEWRSQGMAGRVATNTQVAHVQSFEEYLADLEFFLREVAPPLDRSAHPGGYNIVAHSMGGFLSSKFAARHPDLINKVVLSAPMYGIHLPMPVWLAILIARVICFFGFARSYVFGHKDSDPNKPITGLKLTHCETRHSFWDSLRKHFPIVVISGPSFSWLLAALLAIREFTSKEVGKIQAPVLLLQAEEDTFVDNKAHNGLLPKIPNARKIFYPGTYHELLVEKEPVRSKVMQDIVDFLKDDTAAIKPQL